MMVEKEKSSSARPHDANFWRFSCELMGLSLVRKFGALRKRRLSRHPAQCASLIDALQARLTRVD